MVSSGFLVVVHQIPIPKINIQLFIAKYYYPGTALSSTAGAGRRHAHPADQQRSTVVEAELETAARRPASERQMEL